MRKVAAVINFLAGYFWGFGLLISGRLPEFGGGISGAGTWRYVEDDVLLLAYFVFSFAIILVPSPRRSLLVLAVLTHLLLIPVLIGSFVSFDAGIIGLSILGYVLIWWMGFCEALNDRSKRAKKFSSTWRF